MSLKMCRSSKMKVDWWDDLCQNRCMKFRVQGYRHGDYLIQNVPEYIPLWDEIIDTLHAVDDEKVIEYFLAHEEGRSKSVSPTINTLLKREFVERGWHAESYIFAEEEYQGGKGLFRLDFAKDKVSIEVAFNHGNDAPWNLLKPTLASELNHVRKAIQTNIGVIITATDAMKEAGGFDNAVGSYEKYINFLRPMGMLLTAPLVLIGLEPFETFYIEHETIGTKKIGHPRRINLTEKNDCQSELRI